MSLTQSDLQQIEHILDRKLDPILDKLEALENDIKDIYKMISGLQHSKISDKKFSQFASQGKTISHQRRTYSSGKRIRRYFASAVNL